MFVLIFFFLSVFKVLGYFLDFFLEIEICQKFVLFEGRNVRKFGSLQCQNWSIFWVFKKCFKIKNLVL